MSDTIVQASINEPTFELLDIYTYEFYDVKEYNKFVSNIKRLVRSTLEYSTWVSFIKHEKNLCQYTHESTTALTVDLHHHPYSMENIVKIVLAKQLAVNSKTTTIDVVKEVLQLHYDNKVGYVLLIKSLHEKFHNGYLKIPIEIVNGKWKKFEEEYLPYISNDIMQTVNKYRNITLQNCSPIKWDKDFLIYDEED